MAKLFNNIRKQLVSEQPSARRTSNYLKYAIGEIVLVVIGILIALQINNWNEVRQNEEKITNILEDIQKDLSDDVLSANNVFNRYITNDSLYKLFLDDKLPINSYRYIYFYTNFIIHKNGYLNLTQNSNSIPKKYVGIYKELNNLQINTARNISIFNDRIRTTVYNNLDYLAKNKAWFTDWYQVGMTPEIEQFYRTDMNYRNQTGLYMIDLFNLTKDTNIYKVKAIDTYKKIDSLLGNKTPIPDYMTYQLADTTLLKQLTGHYKWLDGITDQNEPAIVKLKNGNLFVGNETDKDSDLRVLYWFKDKIFFSGNTSAIFNFSIENGNTIFTIKVPNGFQKWIKQ